MSTPLQKLLSFRKFKKLFSTSPEVAVFQMEQKLKDQMEQTIDTHFNDLKDIQDKELQEVKKNALDAVLSQFEASKSSFKGDDGRPPTKEEITQVIDTFLLSNVELFKGQKGDSIKGEKGDSVKGEKGGIGIGIGLRGEKGLDGTLIEPLQIANKLNTTEQTVEMRVIKGLKRHLEVMGVNISNAMSKGGGGASGGMGNIVKERFDIDASTTSVTLKSKVASKGDSIWIDYNGQVLAQDFHYTKLASDKVVTLLFTPTNGTKLTIKYIRT